MVDFPEHVRKLWSAWEIRVFIVSSLILQILLIFTSPFRKGRSSKWFSPFIWAFYLLADWVAAFALGLLSDSQGDSSDDNNIAHMLKRSSPSSKYAEPANSNSELLAFWAPFLLLHLGGPDTITAFALEDNELWLRHLLGLTFEILAASYVFFRAIPMRRLLAPMLLMFLAGIIKYGERTRALYLASMDGFRDSMLKEPDPGPNYAKLMGEFSSKKEAGVPAEIKIMEAPQTSIAIPETPETPRKLDNIKVVVEAHRFFETFKGLIANLIFSSDEKKLSQSFFLNLSAEDAFRVVDVELGFIYEVLYTKAAVVHSSIGYVLRGTCTCAIWASLLLFTFTRKHNYHMFDVGITYALLIGAIALDIIAFIMLIFSDKAIVSLETTRQKIEMTRIKSIFSAILKNFPLIDKPRWSESISQYNLIDFCLIQRPKKAAWIVEKFSLTEYLDSSRKPVEENLKIFIFEELKRKSDFAKNSKTTKMLCSCRGNWVLEDRGFQSRLGWSVEKEFDESLLLWHIATDLCYHNDKNNKSSVTNGTVDKQESSANSSATGDNQESSDSSTVDKQESSVNSSATGDNQEYMEISKGLADYMLYLLVLLPSMMSSMAGIGLIRFRDTLAEAKSFFEKKSKEELETARGKLLLVNTEIEPIFVKGDRSKSVLFDAVRLAKNLEELKERKWKIISEVWVELLSYSACHCRGVAHAARLSKGGELLMFVWFLMLHLGLGEQFCIEAGHARAKLLVEK